MKRLLLVLFMNMLLADISAQFANDNVLYKTVHVSDLCKDLQKNPGYLLLDVRSPGEYHDTSSSTALNIGHLKGALTLTSVR
jgi:3-mercaptopyruvate sulfurtransferase SseA